MQVTDEMVAAAQDATPRWMNATDSEIRYIVEAALAVAGEVAVDVTANIRIQVDEDEFRSSVADAVERLSNALPRNAEGRVTLATLHGAPRSVEVNLGGDMIPDRDGVHRIVRTGPHGDAGERAPLCGLDPYGPLPPMVIPANHPLLDTRGFDDLSAPTPNVQQSIPVTEPRVPIAESALHLYLGVKREVIARMVVQRDDYRPPMPRPVRENDYHEPLYDGKAVKAWYDALPQEADG